MNSERFVKPELSCSSCRFYLAAPPGTPYADTPCSSCDMKHNFMFQKKQIIVHDPELLIDFLERLRTILSHEKRRRILFVVLRNPGIRDAAVAERLDLKRRIVSHHLRTIRLMLPEIMQGKPYAV